MLIDILLHNNTRPTTIICSYSPTNTSSATVRRKFYSQLEKLATCNTWLIGDFNARVGRRISSSDIAFGGLHSNTVGPRSLKGDNTPYDNGCATHTIASQNKLIHVGIHYNARDAKRWTWPYPRYSTRVV